MEKEKQKAEKGPEAWRISYFEEKTIILFLVFIDLSLID